MKALLSLTALAVILVASGCQEDKKAKIPENLKQELPKVAGTAGGGGGGDALKGAKGAGGNSKAE